MKTGVVLIAHGSRRTEANQEIEAMVKLVQQADPDGLYEVAFMQFGSPNLNQAVDKLVEQAVQRIVVMPLFLVTGNHVTQDIPEELDVQQQKHASIEIVMARHFAAHPALVQIIQDRVREAFLQWKD